MIVGRPFFIAYATLTAVAALLLALPKLALVVGFLTLGVAILLPSIWLYVTAMMPGLLLYRAGVHWSLAVVTSIGAAVALAIIPAKIAAPRAERALIELTSGDFRKPLPRRPEQIELIRDEVAFVQKDDDPVEHAACDEICQHLLLTRHVTTVTVIAHALYSEPNVVVSYALATMNRCPTAFDIRTRVLPSTTKARIAGLCIMPSRGVGMIQGLSIRDEELAYNSVPSFSLTTIKLARRVEVSEKRPGEDVPLLRTTEVSISSATTPFSIFTYAGLLTSVSGVGISKDVRTVNPQPLLALMDELGFSLVPEKDRPQHEITVQGLILVSEGPLRADREMVLSILAQPGVERFDHDLQAAVTGWTEKFWFGEADVDDGDLSALSAVTLDRRILRIGGVNALWRGSPGLVALLAEPILTRLAWPVSFPTYDQDRQLAQLVARQDETFLAAHSATLLAMVRDQLSRNTSPLLVAAAKLGAEGIPALLAGIASDDNIVRIDATGAACRAPKDFAPHILPVLKTILLGQGAHGDLIIAVAALAGTEAAEQEIERQPVAKRERLRVILNNATVDGTVRCPDAGY